MDHFRVYSSVSGTWEDTRQRHPEYGIQGAISWGKTLAEAKRMIKESIEGSIEARAIVQAKRAGSVRITGRPLSKAAA